MVFRVVRFWYARVVVARMGSIFVEVSMNLAVALLTITALKCLSRVTKSSMHLYLG